VSVGPVARDASTAEFFDAAAAGRFLLRQCADGHFSEPAAAACTACAKTELRWTPAAGGAALVSWAVVAETAGPTVLVIAELDEGPWWWSQLDLADPADVATLAVGRRLRVEFRRAGEEQEAVPLFVLA
jgi:uncharacterized protein